MQITFAELPAVGLAVEIDGQRFDLVDHLAHTKLDGTETTLLVWQAECATCGEGFITKSPPHSPPQGRRCERHRRPGSKVRARR